MVLRRGRLMGVEDRHTPRTSRRLCSAVRAPRARPAPRVRRSLEADRLSVPPSTGARGQLDGSRSPRVARPLSVARRRADGAQGRLSVTRAWRPGNPARATQKDPLEPGSTDCAGARGAHAAASEPAQRGDRRAPRRLGEDGRPSRLLYPSQARRPQPSRGRGKSRAARCQRWGGASPKIGSAPVGAPRTPTYGAGMDEMYRMLGRDREEELLRDARRLHRGVAMRTATRTRASSSRKMWAAPIVAIFAGDPTRRSALAWTRARSRRTVD